LSIQCFDPEPDACAGQVAPLRTGSFDRSEALRVFARDTDLVTVEFENVPVAAARQVAQEARIFPPLAALEVAQDRLAEKSCFERLGLPTAPFTAVDSEAQLDEAVRSMGCPAIAKTRRLGYDGKGQATVRSPDDIPHAWRQLGGRPAILEPFVPFERELSIVAVRARSGAIRFYPLVENRHRDGILRVSLAPAPATAPALQAQAEQMAERLLAAFDYVGVLCLELFLHDGRLLVNEMAPRVHNSGHWTIEGAETSQFENHLRAGLDWPLGATDPRGVSAMVNLIGALPARDEVLALPGAHLHLYGKPPRPGRKLGHITLRAERRDVLLASLPRLTALAGL
jgi:5-(carboxyamino)imidazole ribonucleotide synthase